MDTGLKAIGFVFVLVLLLVVGGDFIAASNDNREARKSYVQTTCDKARAELDADSERACGEAQDKTNSEYICDISGNCHVDLK